ncbi:MAG: LptF/LptG family permease, partial [Kiloniellales bacterium]
MNATLALPRIRRMRLSPTLLGYIARQFTLWFFSFLGTLTGIILLVSTVDLLDRLAGKDGSLGLVFRMVLLKLPYLAMEVMPFTILFAA